MIIKATKRKSTPVHPRSARIINVRRYSEPGALKQIAPPHLVTLLHGHRDFLAAKGLVLPPPSEAAKVDYEALARLFLSPDDIPPELVEKFHLIHQMSRPDAMDHILNTVRQRQLEIDFAPDSSPADIAAQLLLRDRALFQELHAEKGVAKHRSFTFYVGGKRASFCPPEDLGPLQAALNDWYEKHERRRSARVFWREKDNEWWFYVRHAEPTKREGTVDLKDDESGSLIYRREQHDLVVIDAAAGEMRVHADCKEEPELFRRLFGKYLFGDAEFFPACREKYTLAPILTAGRAALACAGIPGLIAARLKELEYIQFGAHWVRHRCQADDVFTVMEAGRFVVPEFAELRHAKLAITFTDSKRPRIVTIKPSNYAQFGRDDDAVILKPWLARQGLSVRNGDTQVSYETEPAPGAESLSASARDRVG